MSWCHIYYITSVILYIYSGYVTASEYYVSAAPYKVSSPSVIEKRKSKKINLYKVNPSKTE